MEDGEVKREQTILDEVLEIATLQPSVFLVAGVLRSQ